MTARQDAANRIAAASARQAAARSLYSKAMTRDADPTWAAIRAEAATERRAAAEEIKSARRAWTRAVHAEAAR